MDPAVQRQRFAVFAALFGAASILDHAQLGTELGANVGTLAVVAGILAVARPSLAALALLLAAQGAYFAGAFPAVSNLGITHLFVCATALFGLALVAGRRGELSGARLLAVVEPALRLELLVLYAWSCWHKLNAEFFDPDVSCAVALYEKVRTGLSFLPLPEGRGMVTALALSTLAIEGGLPVLLAFRRTRSAGVVLGVLFHLVLGFGSFYAFSAASIALLFLFAPHALAAQLAKLRSTWLARRYTLAMVLLFAAIATSRVLYAWHAERGFLENLAGIDVLGNAFSQRLWWLYVPIAGWMGTALFLPSALTLAELIVPELESLLLFPLVFFANGMSPYIGFKTESSFAMYSNLRTEGGASNHFVVRTPFDLFGYQRDLVQVGSSSDPVLARDVGQTIPFILLRMHVQDARERSAADFALTYVRGGELHHVPSVAAAPEFAEPPHWLERKLLTFRTIQSARCGH